MTNPTPTQRSLAEQFTENTGVHFLDSGGGSGRGWQQKAGMGAEEFLARPSAWVDWTDSLTLDAFHWLDSRLHYEPELDAKFHEWASKQDGSWLSNAQDWAIKRGMSEDERHLGYGEGVVNTYNDPTLLSDTLQYVMWDDERYGGHLILLSTHNGADVRGGYSRPRVYSVSEVDSMYSERIDVYCPGPEAIESQDETLDVDVERENLSHCWDVTPFEVTDRDGTGLTNSDWSEAVEYREVLDEDGTKHFELWCREHDKQCEVFGD